MIAGIRFEDEAYAEFRGAGRWYESRRPGLGFEFFDGLAGPDRRTDEVAPTVYRLALAALGLSGTA